MLGVYGNQRPGSLYRHGQAHSRARGAEPRCWQSNTVSALAWVRTPLVLPLRTWLTIVLAYEGNWYNHLPSFEKFDKPIPIHPIVQLGQGSRRSIRRRLVAKKRDVVQVKNPRTSKYVKIDRSAGKIVSTKKSPGPYKGVPVARKKK